MTQDALLQDSSAESETDPKVASMKQSFRENRILRGEASSRRTSEGAMYGVQRRRF